MVRQILALLGRLERMAMLIFMGSQALLHLSGISTETLILMPYFSHGCNGSVFSAVTTPHTHTHPHPLSDHTHTHSDVQRKSEPPEKPLSTLFIGAGLEQSASVGRGLAKVHAKKSGRKTDQEQISPVQCSARTLIVDSE